MAKEKKQKIVHVENLIIHAKNVEIDSNSHRDARQEEYPNRRERDPWGFFWGWQPREEAANSQETETDENRDER